MADVNAACEVLYTTWKACSPQNAIGTLRTFLDERREGSRSESEPLRGELVGQLKRIQEALEEAVGQQAHAHHAHHAPRAPHAHGGSATQAPSPLDASAESSGRHLEELDFEEYVQVQHKEARQGQSNGGLNTVNTVHELLKQVKRRRSSEREERRKSSGKSEKKKKHKQDSGAKSSADGGDGAKAKDKKDKKSKKKKKKEKMVKL